MSTLLIRNARYIVSCDDQDTLWEHANLFIRDNAIEYIGPELMHADQTIDASDMVVYPGLVNTHHHLYQIFSRNLPEVQRMELFPWLQTLYEVWKNLDEEVVYHSSLTGMAEMLKTGCTTCFDHHYVFPAHAGDLVAAQFRAADTLGMRFHASRGSMDLSQKDGGLPPDSVVQSIDAIMADSERLVRAWHDTSRFSMHQVALAPCSPFSVTGDLMRESAKLARSLGVRLHTHVAETKDEERYTLERFGMRPVAYMESLGWTGPDVWYAHGIHFDDDELRILAETGTGVAHCPASNMKLSSGVCRVPDMLRLHVPVGLALDGSASNDGCDMLEELRVAYLLHRLHSSQDAPTGYDLLRWPPGAPPRSWAAPTSAIWPPTWRPTASWSIWSSSPWWAPSSTPSPCWARSASRAVWTIPSSTASPWSSEASSPPWTRPGPSPRPTRWSAAIWTADLPAPPAAGVVRFFRKADDFFVENGPCQRGSLCYN